LAQPMANIKSKTTAYLIRTFSINLKLRCHKITIIFSGMKMFCIIFRSKTSAIIIISLRMRHCHTNNANSGSRNFQ
jgi:hypothetical protein